mmetsp:Transcript_16110/g.35517  ORF Transcript_16110/g.35517 Transcript_16110/m.35517 type:complete len:292 (+) Transcript_16110:104-979(+)|eukprot:CAMPEP_0204269764 /NCGR_PEP_ID=MMETSP0468-20130131/17129_1 /ASSEMBLY_ACC=CAM_ASM_000383 /TAXON_ID=2969 /ORGANISM="Oxyrrhis marina" /LENGTH=291 /DNA_ID=CAMNT_0051245193 /DNA_START=103 /DNA_END=978 /DNA_ORIENTATION=+
MLPGGDLKSATMFTPGKRKRMNLVAILLNVFVPWVVFCVLFALVSFSFHYQHPTWTWVFVVLGYVGVLAMAMFTWRTKQRNGDPMWFGFAVLALFVAVTLAALLGDMNFWYNMQPFYDIENLNTYPNVDPSVDRGQQRMDAGRVYFAQDSRVDVSRAMGFKNLDIYCVAPIIKGSSKPDTYDFWAVGINCCSGTSPDFRCGQYANPRARSGLRLMRDDQRPFFRLAVQQAEAAFKITAAHPLFFYWMQDPVAEMNAYRDEGFKYYLLGIFSFFAVNLFAVTCAVVGFSKVG